MGKVKSASRLVPPTMDDGSPAPDAVQAASLALALCRTAKVDTWDELEHAVTNGDGTVLDLLAAVRLDEHQVGLIAANASAVRAVGAATPLRTVTVCDTCGKLMVVSGSSSPRKCGLTLGCDGVMVRATMAVRRDID